jgi:probable rRNA maturation factor
MAVRVFTETAVDEQLCDETKYVAEFVLKQEEKIADVGIIFVDDNGIRELNKKYLNHDYVTDVISFPVDEVDGVIEGEIYICVAQADRQAREYKISLKNEISRLAIHGMLHLVGYEDTTPEQRAVMREKEDRYLEMLNVL